MYLLQTVSRSGPRARPEPPSPSPDLGLRMDRATGPASPSPVAHPHCDGGGGWPKVAPTPIRRSDKDDPEEEEGDKSAKTKRKKKKRKKEPKEGGGGKWTFGGLFRRKKKKEEDAECARDSTEEEYGLEKASPTKGINFPPSPSVKRAKNDDEYVGERLAQPCAMHNGCVGCVVTGRPGRSRQRPAFGSGSDCRDSYGGSSLVRRDSSTSSHRERKELIKARVEAMRERLPKDSSSEDEGLPGGSEGSWEWRGKKGPLAGGYPAGGVGSAGSSPYLGRRSRFMGRTERFHQRRLSKEYRDEGEEEETWRRKPNGLPPQCVPWRASQSDVEAPYIGCRLTSANSGTATELVGIGSGSAVSYSPAQSPLQSPILSGRRSASSATSPPYRETAGLPFHGGNRCMPRRYPSTPISPQSHGVEGPVDGRHMPVHSTAYYPMRSRSTDVLHTWRPEEGNYQGSESNPFYFPIPGKQQSVQRCTHEPPQFHQRWPSAPSRRSPPPPPPPRDPQRRIATPQPLSHFQMREQAPLTQESYIRRPYQHQPPPHGLVQPQESPYMNVHPPVSGGPQSQGVTCLADSQPRSRRPLRVTAGGYVGRSGDVSYMSDSQVGPNGRRPLTQHPPLESHFAVPFLADSPPPRCVISRVFREPQLAESVVHNSRPQMRQQRAPVFSRSRSSSPAPRGVNNLPVVLPLRPFDISNESNCFAPRGHSSAPQTPIDGPINRPLSIVSEEKGEISPKVPPVPPARSSSRRSSVSSLEAVEFGMWGMDRNPRPANKGPSGLEDALTELENIYKSLKFDDDVDGETDSVLMGSSETGAMYDDQERPLTDDMAYRRLHSKEKSGATPQQGVGGVVAQAGSYLLVSPTLGPADPWTEPPPNSVNPGEPDVTLDDVVFRSIRQANAHMPPDPQPPFGIPLGPVTRAPDSDYLHAKPPSPSPTVSRTSSNARKTPDIVKDDLAFRSLRKDRMTNGGPVRPVPLRGVTSPPPRPSSSFSCVSSPPPLPNTCIDFQAIRKKRAVRSLSANLLGILQTTNISTRPISPPSPPKSQLPPPSPTSPRKEVRNLVLSPPPTKILTSPPLKIKSPSPIIAASEDSETCVIEAPVPANDATSSDTLTEGHADEPEKKPNKTKEVEPPVSEEPTSPPIPKDSPGEVYEALGRVLSRMGKESESLGKVSMKKIPDEEDDLESLLVALAREARTTSENLGRELDQLRTSSARSPEVPKKQEKVETAIVRENHTSAPASPKKVAVTSEVVGVPATLEGKQTLVVSSASIATTPKIGAIASFTKIDPETTRLASAKDHIKSGGLSVVVGKCTVGRDLSQPGAVSFTSSVSPINSVAIGVISEGDLNQLRNVSAPSAEIPMRTSGASVTVRKESDITSTVSAESAKVPIKSGSMGFVVVRELDVMDKALLEEQGKSSVSGLADMKDTDKTEGTLSTLSKKPASFASAIMKQCEQVKSSPVAAERKAIKSSVLPVRSEPSQSVPISKPNTEDVIGLGFHATKESEKTTASLPTAAESIPITGSMRLIVRKNAESLLNLSTIAPKSPIKTGLVMSKESDNGPSAPSEVTVKTFTGSNQINETATVDNTSNVGESGFVFNVESDRWGEKETKQTGESMSPGAVVDSIKKEFDQIFAIPAKKARKSDDAEGDADSSGSSRLRPRESRSLEHPKHFRDVRSAEHTRKTFPKSLSSGKVSKESVPDSEKGTKEIRKSDAVSSVFEKEFDELWKASTSTKKQEELLDSELERELDQLCSVKVVNQVAEALSVGLEEPKGSKDAAAPGVDGEGEVCSNVSSGSPEDSERAACTLKPAVASPACLTLGIYYPQTTAATVPLDPTTYSSMVSGLFPEAGDSLFTALAAFLALISFVAALIVRP